MQLLTASVYYRKLARHSLTRVPARNPNRKTITSRTTTTIPTSRQPTISLGRASKRQRGRSRDLEGPPRKLTGKRLMQNVRHSGRQKLRPTQRNTARRI